MMVPSWHCLASLQKRTAKGVGTHVSLSISGTMVVLVLLDMKCGSSDPRSPLSSSCVAEHTEFECAESEVIPHLLVSRQNVQLAQDDRFGV
jgi:hypothetical protein